MKLPGLENRYPNQLSGGQRQRVALARAMAIEPKVLLLDEPFGALDAQVRRELRSWLREIHNKTGHTTVFVTHDQEEALELADRVVVMNKGRDRAGRHAGRDLRPSRLALRLRLHRRIVEDSRSPSAAGRCATVERRLTPRRRICRRARARMYFRPYDIELVEGSSAAIEGRIIGRRRTAGTRHIELELTGGDRMEIELSPDLPTPEGRHA